MYQLGVTKIEHCLSPFSMDSLVVELCNSTSPNTGDTTGFFADYFEELYDGKEHPSFESMEWPSNQSLDIFSEQIKLIRFWSNDVSP